jgi:cell division protein FtsQ
VNGTLRQDLPLDIRLMNFTSRALVWLFVLGALASAGNWLLQRPWWSIRSVRVEGSLQHVSATSLRSQALPRVQGNWFTVSLGAVQQAFEQVPWVRKAVVQRVWPLSLLVRLQEQQPLALWLDSSGNAVGLVNTQGESFEANLGEVQDLGLPRFFGPPASQQQVTAMYRDLQQRFAPLRWRIARLGLGAQGDWQVQIAQGPSIDLGNDDDAQAFAERLQRFVRLEPGVAAHYGRAVVSADLRYASGFAVKLAKDDGGADLAAHGARGASRGRVNKSKSRGAR